MSHRQITIATARCAMDRHDLRTATNKELVLGVLRCGCLVDGHRAARMLRAREFIAGRRR